MSLYYGTKNTTREYIVVKHQLKINTEILGIRYRDGYGVVAKNSKELLRLRQIRLAVCEELPITFLPRLKAVVNSKQIKAIWGNDIYRYFLQQNAKKAAQPEELKEALARPFCANEQNDRRCGNQTLDGFTHCRIHIQRDERLKPFIADMKMLPKAEKKKFINDAIKKARSS